MFKLVLTQIKYAKPKIYDLILRIVYHQSSSAIRDQILIKSIHIFDIVCLLYA